MIVFKFETSPSVKNCRVAMATPGFYFNATPTVLKWEAMPADGRPLPAHLLTPTPFAPAGPPASNWRVEVPASPADMAGSVAMVFSADGTGKVFDKIGSYPYEYSEGVQVWIAGGSFSTTR